MINPGMQQQLAQRIMSMDDQTFEGFCRDMEDLHEMIIVKARMEGAPAATIVQAQRAQSEWKKIARVKDVRVMRRGAQ